MQQLRQVCMDNTKLVAHSIILQNVLLEKGLITQEELSDEHARVKKLTEEAQAAAKTEDDGQAQG